MAQWDSDSKWLLNTYPIGYLKAVEVATTTTAIMVTIGATPMVRFTYA